MMFAEVILEGDLNAYVSEAFVCILLLGGALFLLCNLVLGQTPVSSRSALARKRLPLPGVFSAPSITAGSRSPKAPAKTKRGRGLHGHGLGDKRASLRRGGNPVEVLVSEPTASGKPMQGLVVNRSKGGLCLSVSQPMGIGAVLNVRPAHAPEDLPSIRVRVRRCRPKKDGCELGCQFVDSLPWSVLLLFG